MKISELTTRQGNINVTGEIDEIGEIRTFNKYGRELKVANAILKDDSGSIKLTLWNDDAVRFKNSDKIKINNGYINEFQGEKQLTAGKFGSIELVESASNEESGKQENKENIEESNSKNFDEENLEETDETEEVF